MGSSPVEFKFFFLFSFFDLLVFILDFVHNWIYLFDISMRLCNKYNTGIIFNTLTCDELFLSFYLYWFAHT